MFVKLVIVAFVAGLGLGLASMSPLFAADIPVPSSKYSTSPYVQVASAAPNWSASETLTVAGVATPIDNNKSNETLTGSTAGGNVEYLISPGWSFKAEYLFFDLSNNSNGCCFDGTNIFRLFDRELQVDTVKVGFNYFFHPDHVSLK
jgi:opacity protein-like surface antigen